MSDGQPRGLLAHYDSLEGTRQAILSLREDGHRDLQIFSPIPAPGLEEAMDIHSSPVRIWSLLGGVTGCLTGFLLTSGSSLAYPMVTQGKPILSIEPFIVVMFELTILFTGLFTLVGMLVHARRPRLKLSPAYRKEFSVDRWGIWVPSEPGDRDRVRESLMATDPERVEEGA